jgi:hypothetical protein
LHGKKYLFKNYLNKYIALGIDGIEATGLTGITKFL